MTKRNEILEAIVSALNTSRPEGIPEATRTRSVDIDPAALPAMTVICRREIPAPLHGRGNTVLRRRLEVEVECIGKSDGPVPNDDTTTTADEAVEPLLNWVTAKLVDNRLGGKSFNLEELETVFQYVELATAFTCRATLRIGVDYMTRRTDQTLTA